MKTLFLLSSLIFVGCSNSRITKEDLQLQKQANEYFEILPKDLIDTNKEAAKIALGEKLYFETRLSKNNKISCNSCHKLDHFGVDNEITSPGHDGSRGDRNSPTVYNAALNVKQFWDGRAKDLADQAKGPILNPIEHGLASAEEAMKKIKNKEYLAMFKAAFPKDKESFTYDNLGLAIEAFEKTLLTPSRFDQYLAGDIRALNQQERKGLQKFMSYGCISCHNGAGLGGTSFQKLGVVKKYKTKDQGVAKLTGKRRDRFKFKVPLLRNITKTAPYLHDGSIASLDQTIILMSEYQLGKKVTPEDIADMKAFLGSLTGTNKFLKSN